MRNDRLTAALAGLSLVGAAACFLVKGSIPDALVMVNTTLIGGFLGLSLPQSQHTN